MQKLTLSTELNTGSTSISNIFIDQYMPQAGGEFVKIYLYLLRCTNNQTEHVSVSSLADTFNQTEADVMRALRYWDKMGIIALSFQGPNNELSNITFCNLKTPPEKNTDKPNKTLSTDSTPTGSAPVRFTSDDRTAVSTDASDKPAASNVKPITIETRSSFPAKQAYSAAQIQEMSSQEDLKLLLYVVSTYLGKPLSPTESSTIIYFHEELHFPADLIEYLVEYCAAREHRSMRYIEAVALDWAESGITTVKAAKEQVLNHNETTYSVMNAFGIANRNPGQHERNLISKWTDVYCFSSDMIIEACNRTIKATHQPSFEYADSILTRWKESNVKNAADIQKADEAYEQSKIVKKASGSVINKSSNRFNNFEQRQMDNDELERLLLSNNG